MKQITMMMALLCATAGYELPAQLHAQMPMAPSAWEVPAATLAAQVAAILGPGQASFSMRNLSTIPSSDLQPIRRLIEQNLKARGVTPGGQDSANNIRVTLSENSRERLWIAEIIEGSETRVTMVTLPLGAASDPSIASGLVLHHQTIYSSNIPIVGILAINDYLIVAEPTQIVVLSRTPNGMSQVGSARYDALTTPSRDPRAMLLPSPDRQGFQAWLPGVVCEGSSSASSGSSWAVHCRQADDPWPISSGPVMPALAATQATGDQTSPYGSAQFKAFYNPARDYFTGVVTPSPGPDLPAFYMAVVIPQPVSQTNLLIGGIDGKAQMVAGNSLTTLQGARDWGSDFTVVRTGCGSGIQVIASGSADSGNDSLRAYEVAGRQAVPAGSTLPIEGLITALSTATDDAAAYAVVHAPQGRYEVDRVSATCN